MVKLLQQKAICLLPGITIPEDAVDVEINQSGEVWVKIDGQIDLVNVGQINPVIFPNEAGLEAIGDNFFLETTASGAPIEGTANEDGFGEIVQGARNSNVNIVEEITDDCGTTCLRNEFESHSDK